MKVKISSFKWICPECKKTILYVGKKELLEIYCQKCQRLFEILREEIKENNPSSRRFG